MLNLPMVFVQFLAFWKWVVYERKYFKLCYIEVSGDSVVLPWLLPRNFVAKINLKNDLTALTLLNHQLETRCLYNNNSKVGSI